MKTTDRGEVILNENDIFEAVYCGKITNLDGLNIEDRELVDQFNASVAQNADSLPKLTVFNETIDSLEQFDKTNQAEWFMPENYKLYDIVDYLYSQCRTVEQKERVTEELKLFAQHNFIIVLKYLKYLVDTMRSEKIVWGVGRGSSVASYCLYLIGVHKIDSIKYKLDITEFLK